MIDFQVEGRIVVIRLDRVEARNAINGEMAQAIESAIDRFEDDDELWVAILGHYGPVFCAGADLKEIAAVDGPAVAGGTEIALACDLCVAAKGSSFGIPKVKRSLVAAAGGLAVRSSRQLILDAPGQSDAEGMKAASKAFNVIVRTEDAAEGPRAFIEKRPPVWKGR